MNRSAFGLVSALAYCFGCSSDPEPASLDSGSDAVSAVVADSPEHVVPDSVSDAFTDVEEDAVPDAEADTEEVGRQS